MTEQVIAHHSVSLIWVEADPDNRDLIGLIGRNEGFATHPTAHPALALHTIERLAKHVQHDRIKLIVDPTIRCVDDLSGLELAIQVSRRYPQIDITSTNTPPEAANLYIEDRPLFRSSFAVPGFDHSIEQIAQAVIARIPSHDFRDGFVLDYNERTAFIPECLKRVQDFISTARMGYNPDYAARQSQSIARHA